MLKLSSLPPTGNSWNEALRRKENPLIQQLSDEGVIIFRQLLSSLSIFEPAPHS